VQAVRGLRLSRTRGRELINMTREAVKRVEVTYENGRVEAWEGVFISRGASRLVAGRVESPECSSIVLSDSKRVAACGNESGTGGDGTEEPREGGA
jgi:hypothetical protein